MEVNPRAATSVLISLFDYDSSWKEYVELVKAVFATERITALPYTDLKLPKWLTRLNLALKDYDWILDLRSAITNNYDCLIIEHMASPVTHGWDLAYWLQEQGLSVAIFYTKTYNMAMTQRHCGKKVISLIVNENLSLKDKKRCFLNIGRGYIKLIQGYKANVARFIPIDDTNDQIIELRD